MSQVAQRYVVFFALTGSSNISTAFFSTAAFSSNIKPQPGGKDRIIIIIVLKISHRFRCVAIVRQRANSLSECLTFLLLLHSFVFSFVLFCFIWSSLRMNCALFRLGTFFGTAVCDWGQTHRLLHHRAYLVKEPIWDKSRLLVHQRVCCCNHQTGDARDVNFNLHRLARNFLPFSSVFFLMKPPCCRSDESADGAGDPVFLPFLPLCIQDNHCRALVICPGWRDKLWAGLATSRTLQLAWLRGCSVTSRACLQKTRTRTPTF